MEPNKTTHRWVAERMGYSVSGVSLLRNGHRQPTIETMEKVEEAFDWPMCDQVAARDDYAKQFNQIIEKKHQEETQDA